MEDERGFMERGDKGEGCKCIGTWRVYGDVESAKKTFCRYEKCTRVYCEQYHRGKSMEELTVSTTAAGNLHPRRISK